MGGANLVQKMDPALLAQHADGVLALLSHSFTQVQLGAMDAIARQPEAAGDIKGNALILAAFVEGVALFAAVIGLLLANK